MLTSWKDDPRSATNPLFNSNRLKLGVFGLNGGEQILTLAPERYMADWARCDAIVGTADNLGLEAAVSLMGWGVRTEMEPYTWATALGARHRGPAIVATMHIQLMHPAFVAKAAATADLVSNGRFGLNLVAGNSPATFGTFGKTLEDHETRYAHAAEWIQLLWKFWTEEEPFDFEGRFYSVKKSVSLPKPIQQFPAIMNAGTSGRGRDFACQHADLVFTHLPENDDDGARSLCEDYRRHAREQFGREIQLWTHGYAVIRDTEKEAQDFLNYYAVEHADKAAIDAWVANISANMVGAEDWKLHRDWAAGGGVALVGTGEQVSDRLGVLSRMGIDGILINSLEPETMLTNLAKSVLPHLEAAGLRKPKPDDSDGGYPARRAG